MKKIIILVIVGIILLTSFNSIINAGEQSNSDKIVTVYSFKSPVFSKVDINNIIYDSRRRGSTVTLRRRGSW